MEWLLFLVSLKSLASWQKLRGNTTEVYKKKNVMEKMNMKGLLSFPTRDPAEGSCNPADVGSKPMIKGGLHMTSS